MLSELARWIETLKYRPIYTYVLLFESIGVYRGVSGFLKLGGKYLLCKKVEGTIAPPCLPSLTLLVYFKCCNRRNHGQTIHPTENFISMNLLQMSCVKTWAQKNSDSNLRKKNEAVFYFRFFKMWLRMGTRMRMPGHCTGQKCENSRLSYIHSMAIRVVEFSNGGYKIRKIFA